MTEWLSRPARDGGPTRVPAETRMPTGERMPGGERVPAAGRVAGHERMPWTMAALVIAGLSLIGVPATAGTVFVAALPIILGFQLILAALMLDVLSSPTRKRHRERTQRGAGRAGADDR